MKQINKVHTFVLNTENEPLLVITVGPIMAKPKSKLFGSVRATLNVPLQPHFGPNELIRSQYFILRSVPQPISFAACSPSRFPQVWTYIAAKNVN